MFHFIHENSTTMTTTNNAGYLVFNKIFDESLNKYSSFFSFFF